MLLIGSHHVYMLNGVSVFVVLQGSYGVVKLAYNEDDDKHYVSRRFSVPSPHIASAALEETSVSSVATKSACNFWSVFKAVLPFVHQVAALRSALSGECGGLPAHRDEVVLFILSRWFVPVIALWTWPLRMWAGLYLNIAELPCAVTTMKVFGWVMSA